MTEKNLKYDEKLELLKTHLDFNDMLFTGEELFKVVSLVSCLTLNMRKKDPKITPLVILNKAYINNESSIFTQLYEMISLLCELTMKKDTKYNLYGCKTAKEMLEIIKISIDNWLPF